MVTYKCKKGSNPERVEQDLPLLCPTDLQKSIEQMLTIKFSSLSHLISIAKLPASIYPALEQAILVIGKAATTYINFFILNKEQQETLAQELQTIVNVIKSNKKEGEDVSGDLEEEAQESKASSKQQQKKPKLSKNSTAHTLFNAWVQKVKIAAAKKRVRDEMLKFLSEACRREITFEEFKQKCPKHFEMYEKTRYVAKSFLQF